MHIHASCAARDGHGVLLIGPPGSGKSDLLVRLLADGFSLVADDQVVMDGVEASAPAALAGLVEVWGIGIVRRPYARRAEVRLAVRLGMAVRMPEGDRYALPGGATVPAITLDAATSSAAARVALALECATGAAQTVAGAFA